MTGFPKARIAYVAVEGGYLVEDLLLTREELLDLCVETIKTSDLVLVIGWNEFPISKETTEKIRCGKLTAEDLKI